MAVNLFEEKIVVAGVEYVGSSSEKGGRNDNLKERIICLFLILYRRENWRARASSSREAQSQQSRKGH